MGRSSFIYYRIGAVHATSGPFKARECRLVPFSSFFQLRAVQRSLLES